MNMTPTEKIKVLLDRKKMTIGTLADVTGQTRQNLSNKLKRDNFSYNELKAFSTIWRYCSFTSSGDFMQTLPPKPNSQLYKTLPTAVLTITRNDFISLARTFTSLPNLSIIASMTSLAQISSISFLCPLYIRNMELR